MITCYFEDKAKAQLRHATVDTLVVKDEQILLVKRSTKLNEGGKWCLPGGFMERDETVIQAAERETFEETGWKIKNIKLLTIRDKPDRRGESRQNISFIFIAEGIEQTGTPDWESSDVRWFAIDELPLHEQIAFDHADNFELYKAYKQGEANIPIFA